MSKSNVLIDVNNINKSFKNPDQQELQVISNVNFTMHEGEIIALLGKSGSGKSTLLRIIAGLMPPTSGEVRYRNQLVKRPVAGISMVFQSFALMPWLSVLENVELGLEAQGVSRKQRRQRALEAIDMIGMDGFESAYPKELSGGMRQRVGFARALVVNPDLLLMDEPFSALDVLTAENLRNDLMELWQESQSSMKGVLFVTHNIEEAVQVADRIFVFSSNPGTISGELKIDLPQERNSQDPQFTALVDEIYRLMTTAAQQPKKTKRTQTHTAQAVLDYRLPDVRIAELIGLLEEVQELQEKGPLDLPELADAVRLDIDTLFPVLEALNILGLATVSEGDISMTRKAKELLEADITEKKEIFASLLLMHIPLARHICDELAEKLGKRASQERFHRALQEHFSEEEAERVLTTMIDWGRYAELFAYDYDTGLLSLEDVE